MKSLASLIKLQKSRVDEQRLLLLALQEQLAKIEEEIRRLKEEEARQRALVENDPDMGLTFGDYIKKAIAKGNALEKKRKTTEIAVSIARDKLAELFEEQKRYEIAEENRQEEEAREEARRERIDLDEVGSVGFVRRKKGQKGRK